MIIPFCYIIMHNCSPTIALFYSVLYYILHPTHIFVIFLRRCCVAVHIQRTLLYNKRLYKLVNAMCNSFSLMVSYLYYFSFPMSEYLYPSPLCAFITRVILFLEIKLRFLKKKVENSYVFFIYF